MFRKKGSGDFHGIRVLLLLFFFSMLEFNCSVLFCLLSISMCNYDAVLVQQFRDRGQRLVPLFSLVPCFFYFCFRFSTLRRIVLSQLLYARSYSENRPTFPNSVAAQLLRLLLQIPAISCFLR